MDGDDEPKHRNVSSTCSDIFLEQLIEEVKKYPCLYAMHSLQYRDVAAKERCWNEIAKLSNRHSSGLKKEWKKLRDCYRQALVTRTRYDPKKKNLRPWKFEKQMEFLKPYITPRSRHLDGSQTSSENEAFDQNNVMVKQEPTSDDDNPDMTAPHSSTTQPKLVPPTRLLRSQVGVVRPPPSSKPPRKRNKKDKSHTSSNDIPTGEPSFATSTSTNASESDSRPSTSSQTNDPHIASTHDMSVEADNSQEQKPIITTTDTLNSTQLKTSFPIAANILENNNLTSVTTNLGNNTLLTVTTALGNNTFPTVTTALESNTFPTVTTTLGSNTFSAVSTTFGDNTLPIVTTIPGNNTLPTVTTSLTLPSLTTTLVSNALPTVTTTLVSNALPTVTTTLRNNTLPTVASTLGNSTLPPDVNTLGTKANNSLPINTSTYGNNVLPTTTSTFGNGSRMNYTFPVNLSILGNNALPQSNSTLGSTNIAHPPTVSNFGNSNSTHSISTGPLPNYNVFQELNGYVDSTGQLHNIIIPVPISTVRSTIDASLAKSVCRNITSRPPGTGNLGNNKAQKPLSFSHFVDVIGNINQYQLFKPTPTSTSRVGNNNTQQENSMDTSTTINRGNKNQGNSKSTSIGSSSYDPPPTDRLIGNSNNGSTQTDGTIGNKNHPQSTESLVGNINNSLPRSVGNSYHPQSISSPGNNILPQYSRNDCLTSDRTFGNTSTVSSQTASATNNGQMCNLMPTSIVNYNDSQENCALQLFFNSMYESTKKLPMKHQNNIKKDLFESVLTAEKRHYEY